MQWPQVEWPGHSVGQVVQLITVLLCKEPEEVYQEPFHCWVSYRKAIEEPNRFISSLAAWVQELETEGPSRQALERVRMAKR